MLLNKTGWGLLDNPEDKWFCAGHVCHIKLSFLVLFPAFLAPNMETLFILPSGVSPGLVCSQQPSVAWKSVSWCLTKPYQGAHED